MHRFWALTGVCIIKISTVCFWHLALMFSTWIIHSSSHHSQRTVCNHDVKFFSLSTLTWLVMVVTFLVGSQGAVRQIIVDDADTKILYSSSGWATETTCPACFPQLDMSQVRDRTWHFSKYAYDFYLFTIVSSRQWFSNTANSGFTFFFTDQFSRSTDL